MDPALRRLVEAGARDDEVAVMVRLLSATPSLPAGVRIVSRFGEIATVRVARRTVEALRAAGDVRSVKAPRSYRPELVRVDAESVAVSDTDWRRPEGLTSTGRGVLVGVVDWGLDVCHPAFLESGRSRVEALWDQSAPYDPVWPNRFGYGRVHRREAIDAALAEPDPPKALGYDAAEWDVGGGTHGTATTSVAAGSAWPGGVEGVAPEADIAFVNLAGAAPLGHSVALGEAVDFIRETAGNRPWVCNMSLGRHGGPHDGSTLLERLLDAAVRDAPCGMVVNSGGNYFASDVHTTARLSAGERLRVPLQLDEPIADVHEIDIWYRGVDRLLVGLEAPDGRSIALARPESDKRLNVDGGTVARVQHRALDPNNGSNEAVCRILPGAPPGRWHLVLVGAEVADGRFHAWIEREAARPGTQARFEPDDAVTTTTTGTICNGLRNIAVGAYDHRNPGRPLTRFSSSGDTVDGRRKPAVLAPGEKVLVARSRPRGIPAEDAPLSTRMSGTSMAAPFVTGTIACLMEESGSVPGARLRAGLLRSAERVDAEEAVRAGSGYADIQAAVDAVRSWRRSGRQPPGSQQTTEVAMSTIHQAPAALQPADPGALPSPDQVLRNLGMSARGLFEIYVLNRREADRERLVGKVEVVAGAGDHAAGLPRPGDLLVRGVMGEGVALLAVLVTGELYDLREAQREDLELEGSLPGRYAWVVEGGSHPRAREDRFARRITDRRGYLPNDHVLLRLLPEVATATAAPAAAEWWPFPIFPPQAPTPSSVRVRRNVTSLSASERAALVTAITELKRRRIYHEFVRDHANSMENAHRQPAFLPWHRQFILIFESELRAVDPSVTLPYWDWSADPGRDGAGNPTWNAAMVALMGGNGTGPYNAVTSGPFAGWTAVNDAGNDTPMPLQRSFGTTSWARSLPTAAQVTAALAITPYDASPWDEALTTAGFRNDLEGFARDNHLHNVVHGWVGGSMLPMTSPNDPCFFLHHCFVDKIWADWQATHPSLGYLPGTRQSRSGAVPAWGPNDDVPVFRVTSASPVTYKAADTLNLSNLRDHKGATGIQVRYA